MDRNPINIIQDTVNKAMSVITLALTIKNNTQRLKKLKVIDLRKYRGDQAKKDRIRKIMNELQYRNIALISQSIIQMSQPIQRNTLEKGGNELVGENNNEFIVSRR